MALIYDHSYAWVCKVPYETERDRQTERKRVRRKNAKNKALSLGECKTNWMLTW